MRRNNMIKQIEKNDCGQTTVRYILSKFSKCNYYASYPLKRKCDNVFQIKEELSDNGLIYDCYELNNDKIIAMHSKIEIRANIIYSIVFKVLNGCIFLTFPDLKNRADVTLKSISFSFIQYIFPIGSYSLYLFFLFSINTKK